MIFSIEGAAKSRRSNVVDTTIYRRIIAAYKKAKKLQASSSNVYQVGNEWLPIYNRHMGRIVELLNKSDVPGLIEIYNNFFRDVCSSGLHGLTLDLESQFAGDEIHQAFRDSYFSDNLHRLKLWIDLMEQQVPVAALQSSNVGNPYGYTLGSAFIRTGSDYHHYYATIINRLVRVSGRQTVAEIGGGYGGMAYFLIRDNPFLTYIDIDLPENIALTSFYLLSSFPDKKIALYGEVDLDAVNLNVYDAVLLPNVAIPQIKGNSVDLTFNSYSLAEMSRETVDYYVKATCQFTSKFFMHVNHVNNSLVKAADFCVDREKFELVYRAPALWNMSRNPQMDEFEFLYKNKALVFASRE